MTIHDNNDPNRPRSSVEETPTPDPYGTRPSTMANRGMGWGVPLGIAAIAIMAGLYFMMPDNDRATTASTNTPVTSQTTTPPTPAPADTPAAPTRMR